VKSHRLTFSWEHANAVVACIYIFKYISVNNCPTKMENKMIKLLFYRHTLETTYVWIGVLLVTVASMQYTCEYTNTLGVQLSLSVYVSSLFYT